MAKWFNSNTYKETNLYKLKWIVVCKIFVKLYFKVFETQWIIKCLNCDI